MKELLENAKEFLESGEENLLKKRYNVAASDFFKASVIYCDYLIFKDIKRLPKNHNDRFELLNIHFKELYEKISYIFKIYVQSYNLKLGIKEVLILKEHAYEIQKLI